MLWVDFVQIKIRADLRDPRDTITLYNSGSCARLPAGTCRV